MKIITICSSVSFYKQVIEVEKKLKRLGYKVLIPMTARKMQKKGDFTSHKTWYQNKNDYHLKTKLMDGHFKKVIKGDVILVVNYEKNSMKGYIGGNVLMEMTVAYLNKKNIFILNKIDEKLPLAEEVYGLNSIFLDGDLENIKTYLK